MWVCYDLGARYEIDTLEIWNASGAEYGAYFWEAGFQDVTIQYSQNDYNWTTLVSGQALVSGPLLGDFFTPTDTINFSGATARYVLITSMTDQGENSYTGLDEVRFNGTLAPIVPPGAGDVNDDWIVGGADITQVIHNWGMASPTWSDGDVAGSGGYGSDGVIDQYDYDAVDTAMGTTYPLEPADPAPETATLGLLLLGGLALIRRRY